jgi:AFG1-like ATPase
MSTRWRKDRRCRCVAAVCEGAVGIPQPEEEPRCRFAVYAAGCHIANNHTLPSAPRAVGDVEGIPRLAPGQRDMARRFNILIDTLYEARTLLIASAEVPPEAIYAAGDGTFEFRRTISRLIEMQSEDYASCAAVPSG